jgi:dTDP-4-dehydrorhamnose reductase
MDDFAEIVAEARASRFSCVTHLTVMNEVSAYDIAKALKPRKSMELYNSLYRDLDEALRARRDRSARPDPARLDRTRRQRPRRRPGQ